jgi:predicted DNA-binding ribbon-helix-helix protein
LAFELKGQVDSVLLEESFFTVWEKTDLKNIRFNIADGTFRNTELTLRPSFLFSQPAREGDAKGILTKEFETPFDLEKEAPIRLQLLEVKPGKYILGVVAHHIAIDGWSLAKLLEKVCDVYNAKKDGLSMPAIPWESFIDYEKEFHRQQGLPPMQDSRSYWSKKEFNAPPLLANYSSVTKGHRAIYILNKKYYQKVKELARHNKVTPFLFLLTCFMRSMAKVLKKDAFLLAVPIASRDWDQAEFVIGNCVNLMPMDLHLDPNNSLVADLEKVKAQYIDSIGHTLVPVAEIERAKAQDLTQVHFNFEPSAEEPKLSGAEIEFYPFPINHVEKPIIINVNDTKKTYYIELDYQFQAIDLIKALTIFTEAERVINQFSALHTPKP